MSVRPYESLAVKPDFQEFIKELLTRLGIKDSDLDVLFNADNNVINMKEFAKCFVIPTADPNFNNGLYNLAGDTYVNGGIVMYFLNAIQNAQEEKAKRTQRFKPSNQLVNYFSKLKAKYVSNKEFDKIAKSYGFEDFIIYGPRDPIKDITQYYASECLLAFFGCFELLIDRYIKPYSSHIYVSHFVNVIFDSLDINYHPSHLYDIITLLKETNDMFQPPNTPGIRYEVSEDEKDPNTTVLYEVEYTFTGFIKHSRKLKRIEEVGIIYNRTDESKLVMSQRAYDWLKQKGIREGFRVKEHPTVEELNIEMLCDV